MGEFMRALAGVMKYIGIVLISGILILSFCVGLMFFMPKIRIFGYYFRQVDMPGQMLKSVELSEKFLSGSGSTKIIALNIEASNYDVIIKPTTKEKIEIFQESDYVGFLKGTKINEGTPSEKVVAEKYPQFKEANLNKSDPDIGFYHWIFVEPEGKLSMRADNSITICVPYKVGDTNLMYDINLKTKDGDIHLTNSVNADTEKYEHSLRVNSISLTTRKGNAFIEGVSSSTIEEKDDEGNTIAHRSISLNNLDITTEGGKFDFTNYDTLVVNNKVSLNSKNAKYTFNTLRTYSTYSEGNLSGGIEIQGENIEFIADTVYCGQDGFSYKSNTGVLKINRLISGKIEELEDQPESIYGLVNKFVNTEKGVQRDNDKKEFFIKNAIPYENTIFTDSASVKLGCVVGKLGLNNELGDVEIGCLSHQASVRTENGNINIGESGIFPDERTEITKSKNGDDLKKKYYSNTSSLILYSIYGNISVGEYYQDAVVYSKKGKIDLVSKYIDKFETKGDEAVLSVKTFNESDKSDEITIFGAERYYYTSIKTKDGRVNITSDKNPIKVEASDNATINVVLKDILPENKVLGQYQKYNDKTGKKELTEYHYSLNPFGQESYMYQFITENGTVDATLPMKSYKIKIDCNKIEGNIGATGAEDFKQKDADGKLKPFDVQISNNNAKQPRILIDGKNAKVRSTI